MCSSDLVKMKLNLKTKNVAFLNSLFFAVSQSACFVDSWERSVKSAIIIVDLSIFSFRTISFLFNVLWRSVVRTVCSVLLEFHLRLLCHLGELAFYHWVNFLFIPATFSCSWSLLCLIAIYPHLSFDLCLHGVFFFIPLLFTCLYLYI